MFRRRTRGATRAAGEESSRFTVWWAAEILAWHESLEDGAARLQYAMTLLTRQDGLRCGSFQVDGSSVCFQLVTSRSTKTVASAAASRALRTALSDSGIGMAPAATWSLLQLDLDPTPLDLQPVVVDELSLERSVN